MKTTFVPGHIWPGTNVDLYIAATFLPPLPPTLSEFPPTAAASSSSRANPPSPPSPPRRRHPRRRSAPSPPPRPRLAADPRHPRPATAAPLPRAQATSPPPRHRAIPATSPLSRRDVLYYSHQQLYQGKLLFSYVNIFGAERWRSAFITENCGDPDWFTSCRRYLFTSHAQFATLCIATWQLIVFEDRNGEYPNLQAYPHMRFHVWPNHQCELLATPIPFICSPAQVQTLSNSRHN